MKQIVCITMALCLAACGQGEKEGAGQQEASGAIHITTDWTAFDDNGMNLSELVNHIEFVPLETTDDCLLRGIRQAEIMGDYIYISDRDGSGQADGIYQFDRKGKFLRKIGSRGGGPREFVGMWGFTVNPETEEIYIEDCVRNNMVAYRPDGTFSRIIRLGHETRSFVYKEGLFYLYNPDWEGDDSDERRVIVMDTMKQVKARYFEPVNMSGYHGDSGVRKTSEGEVLLSEELNDTIYTFDGEKLQPKYIFDFGVYAMPQEKKEAYWASCCANKPNYGLLNEYITQYSDVWETENWLHFRLKHGDTFFDGYYNKKDGTVKLTYLKDDIYTFLWDYIGTTGNERVGVVPNGLLYALNPNMLRNLLEKGLPQHVKKGKMTAAKLDSLTAFFSRYVPIDLARQREHLGNQDDKPKTAEEQLHDELSLYFDVEGEELNPMLVIVTFK